MKLFSYALSEALHTAQWTLSAKCIDNYWVKPAFISILFKELVHCSHLEWMVIKVLIGSKLPANNGPSVGTAYNNVQNHEPIQSKILIQIQQKLMHFTNYYWVLGPAYIQCSCSTHQDYTFEVVLTSTSIRVQ